MQLTKALKEKINQAKSDPHRAILYVLSLLRGALVKIRFRPFASRIQIGSRFRARSGIHIHGPGKVIIGNNVTVDLNFLRIPSIITHTKESCVIIGDGCYLGGTRISCVGSVEIGEEGLFGSMTIIDSDIIPTDYMTLDNQWIEQHVRSVQIGSHFWAGTNAFVLKGAHIGDECVLGAGAMVYDKTFANRSLLIGNPARKIGSTR
jgi:acetyltransferase-like isoleucine patch superfamily enzyme